MDLTMLANLAEVIGTLTILVGGIFAVVQLSEFRAQRRQDAAMQMIRSFAEPQLAHAHQVITALPDGLSGDELRMRGDDCLEAAMLVAATYETMGYLVYRRMIPFLEVRELSGGLTLVLWRKLRGWVETVRDEQSQRSFAEWFNWLADQLARQSEEKESRPAYVTHAEWRPTR